MTDQKPMRIKTFYDATLRASSLDQARAIIRESAVEWREEGDRLCWFDDETRAVIYADGEPTDHYWDIEEVCSG